MNDIIFDKLIKYTIKKNKNIDVPVAAFVVKNNKIISRGFNSRINKYRTINHAEIIAINKANKKLKNCFLYDCDLYVTLKPCEMCEKVINNSRIKNVYYLLEKPDFKKEYNKTKYDLITDNNSEIYKEIIHTFFDKIRK